ncbi:MAG: histidinol-phosphatase [Deltaproteobacteria bacterium]|nr:histidinol-phosphatase [Deltaproteobacteria bacterium]
MFNHEYIGNLHIHSHYSDGAGSVAEIADAANRVGIDFIGFNDHEYLAESLNLADEGFYGNVVVLIGHEIGKRYHHYLAYDLRKRVLSNHSDPQKVIDQVNAQGGFGFLAHPFEKGMPFKEKSIAYTWNDLSVTSYTGVCIWNFSSRWKERIKTLFHGLFFLAFKHQTLKGPSRETLSFWDGQCQKRRVVAIGGSDAHGSDFHVGSIRFRPFSYDYLLKTINVHVFLSRKIHKDFKEAKKDIYDAIRQGRLFIANNHISPARGFRFYFISKDGSELFMGEEDHFKEGDLVIKLPSHGVIRLIRNGILAEQWEGKKAVHKIQAKGVYRVEVHKPLFLFGKRPWIFSNPIYFR